MVFALFLPSDKNANAMKNHWILWAALALPLSCQELFDKEEGEGELRWSFSEKYEPSTKATSQELPDTNDFRLEVKDASGSILYSGPYGESPESMLVKAGAYTVTALSGEFTKPQFDAPQWGDTQQVLVEADRTATAVLSCHQMNAGIRLRIQPNFLTVYPKASMFVKSDAGKLLYSYSEKRIAYFPPSDVSVVMSNEGKDETLITRKLAARQILTVGISAPETEEELKSSGPRITISIDTTRVWNYEHYTIGDEDTGGQQGGGEDDLDKALGIGQARTAIGSEGVWVYGYIVGGDLTSSANGMKQKAPFTSRTNLALGTRASITDKSSCLSVNLLKGEIRDAINLVDHPEMLGKRIYLKGDIVSAYYGIPGLKNVTAYVLK